MKVYAKCEYCKSDVSKWIWAENKVDLKKTNGETIKIQFSKCSKSNNINIDKLKARESKIAQIISILAFLAGTPVLFLLVWDYLFKTNNIYSIAILVTPIIVPSIIYSVVSKCKKPIRHIETGLK